MSIKIKISLMMAALVVLVLVLFSSILYFSQSRVIYAQERLRHATIAESLAQVAEESLLSGDDFSLISYTFKLPKNSALATAYVFDGQKYLSHTDKQLVRIVVAAPQEFNGPDDETISKEIMVGGNKYLVRTVFSKKIVTAGMRSALDRIFLEILKVSLVVFLISMVTAYFFALSLVAPVLKLSMAAREVGKGDLSVEMDTSAQSGGGDEMDTLKRDFNSMVARLRQLDEMKKDFVSSVTHELKSPLSAVESYVDLLSVGFVRAQGKADAGMKQMLAEWIGDVAYIQQNTRRLFTFINDLLDTAKMERGVFGIKKSKVDMAELIAQAIRVFAIKSEGLGVKLETDKSLAPLSPIIADGERVKQVLLNLISNALKYTRPEGKITVSAEMVDDLRLTFLCKKHQPSGAAGAQTGYALICVSDTGVGIPAGDLERVFGKFEQVKTSGYLVKGSKGVGLGLYIAKSIVEAHGGDIWVESTEGAGSRFYFALPRG